jgi:hypothetical protein
MTTHDEHAQSTPLPSDARKGSLSGRIVDGDLKLYFEGTRREIFDIEMVWIDVSDDDPSGFSSCGLYGFDANIVGEQSADGATSRRVPPR